MSAGVGPPNTQKVSMTVPEEKCFQFRINCFQKGCKTGCHSDSVSDSSRKHTYIILTPLNPILCSKTGVYRGIYYFFIFLLKNIDCGYSLEPPRRGGFNEYGQSMF